MAALYPEQVESLILTNGASGRVFDSAFQPFFRIPFMSNVLHKLVDKLVHLSFAAPDHATKRAFYAD